MFKKSSVQIFWYKEIVLAWLNKTILTLLGIRKSVCPFLVTPASTFPMRTVPMSLYLSTTGIINGPSIFRFNDGNSSMSWINDGPRYHGQISSVTWWNKNKIISNHQVYFIRGQRHRQILKKKLSIKIL